MHSEPWLRWSVTVRWLGLLISVMSSTIAIAQSADSICRESSSAAAVEVRLYEALSGGGLLVASPMNAMATRFSRCHLARWNEPSEEGLRMIVFVYNNSDSAMFTDARLTIEATYGDTPVTSGYVSIEPKGTGVFLFVGPAETIGLRGIYGGTNVRFERRALPRGCGTITLEQTLRVVEAFDSTSKLRSRLPNLDSDANVQIIRIQFDDEILAGSRADQGSHGHVYARLSEDRDATAFIECS